MILHPIQAVVQRNIEGIHQNRHYLWEQIRNHPDICYKGNRIFNLVPKTLVFGGILHFSGIWGRNEV